MSFIDDFIDGVSQGGIGSAAIGLGALLSGAGGWAAFAAFSTSLGLSGLSAALAPKPKTPTIPGQAQTVTTHLSSDTRRIVYGRTRVGGQQVYKATTQENRLYHQVIVLADHQIEEIEDVFITIDDTHSYTDDRYYYEHISGATDIYFTGDDNSDLPNSGYIKSTTTMLGDGVLQVTIDGKSSPSWFLEVSGSTSGNDGLYMIRDTPDRQDTAPTFLRVLRLTGNEQNESAIIAESAGASITIARRYVMVNMHLGDQSTADFDLIARTYYAFTDDPTMRWRSDSYLMNMAYIYVCIPFRNDAWSGEPKISALIKGKKVYNYSTASTIYTDNAASIIADYITDTRHGIGGTVNSASVIAAEAICDEAVPLAGGGTESRYTINGIVDSGQRRREVIQQMAEAMAGEIVYSNGEWYVEAGEWGSVNVSLDEDDLRGIITVQTNLPQANTINAVRGTMVSPDHDYQPTDFPAVISDTAYAEDNSVRAWLDLTLQFTNSFSMAQRIAKIELLKARQPISFTANFGLNALKLRPASLVYISNDHFGWSDKVFRVTEWQFVLDQEGAIDIAMTLRETASNIYDWDTSEEQEVDPAPNTNLPSPSFVAQPTNFVADSSEAVSLIVDQNGHVIERIKLTWTAPNDPFVLQNGWIDVQYRETVGTTDDGDPVGWTSYAALEGRTTETYITGVKGGELYDLRIRARNHLGFASAFVYINNHRVIGGTAPPPDVPWFQVVRQVDGTREYSWRYVHNPPADLKGFIIRYALDGVSAFWDYMLPLLTSDDHGRVPGATDIVIPSSPFELNFPPAGTHTFAIKAVDVFGNMSTNANYITVTLGDPRIEDIVDEFNLMGPHRTETVSNGSFDSATTGWTGVNCSLSILNQTLKMTSTGDGTRYAYQNVNVVKFTKYYIGMRAVASQVTGVQLYCEAWTTDSPQVRIDRVAVTPTLWGGTGYGEFEYLAPATGTIQIRLVSGQTSGSEVVQVDDATCHWFEFWPGTKTDCFVNKTTGALQPTSQLTWDDVGEWGLMGAWNPSPSPSFSYIHDPIDLGGEFTFEVLPVINISATSYTIFERHSSSTGSPISWSSYAAISGPLTARHIQFKIEALT